MKKTDSFKHFNSKELGHGNYKRVSDHINYGSGRVFLPQWRMREIRHEESIRLSRLKREGKKAGSTWQFDCQCGSISCLGNILNGQPNR